MDGYAARAADLGRIPARLRVVGSVPAGQAFAGSVGPGQAVRIFTGAPVPEGADCIVIQEDTERDGDAVIVREGAREGRYVRPAGLDFREGEVGLVAGRRLTVRDVGLAAAMNRPWLLVRRRPRVAILPTGDEVVMPGDPVGANQIVSSNGLALAALVTACSGIPIQLAIAPDDSRSLQRIAEGAQGADMLVTTGGASVGEHDLVRRALHAEGLDLSFWRIALRPGKPMMHGRLGHLQVLGMPGNPVSSYVCSFLFLVPLIRKLSGRSDIEHVRQKAILGRDLPENDEREDYLRAVLSQGPDGEVATPVTSQDSSLMGPLSRAGALVIRPPHAPAAAAGARVDILKFGH
jgi:molybdopterin molybdotransferase